MDSILEITDTAYCLKLSKDTFDLAFIRRLLKRIESDPIYPNVEDEGDIISKSFQNDRESPFDRLSDK